MSKLSIKAVEKVQREEKSLIEIFPVEEEEMEEEVEAEVEAKSEEQNPQNKVWVIAMDTRPNKNILNKLSNSVEFRSSMGHNRSIVELQRKGINTIFICLDSKVNVNWLKRNLTLYRERICLVVGYSKLRSKQQKYVNDLADCDYKVRNEDISGEWLGEEEFFEVIREASYVIHKSVSLCGRLFCSKKLIKKKK